MAAGPANISSNGSGQGALSMGRRRKSVGFLCDHGNILRGFDAFLRIVPDISRCGGYVAV